MQTGPISFRLSKETQAVVPKVVETKNGTFPSATSASIAYVIKKNYFPRSLSWNILENWNFSDYILLIPFVPTVYVCVTPEMRHFWQTKFFFEKKVTKRCFFPLIVFIMINENNSYKYLRLNVNGILFYDVIWIILIKSISK